jgi:GAF domain-containing protein
MTVHETLPLLQAGLAAILVLVISWKSWEEPVNRLFAVFLLSMTLWGVMLLGMRLTSDLDQSVWWGRAEIVFIASTWVLFYHFALRYSNVKGWSYRLLGAYLYLAAIIALAPTDLIVEGTKEGSYGNAPIWGLLFLLFIIPVYVLVLVAVYQLNEARMTSSSYAERNRFLYFSIGGASVLVGGLIDLSPIMGTDIYPGTILANLFFVFLTSIAVLRYHLFDVQVATYRVTPYVAMLILVGGIYASIYALVYHFWGGIENEPLWLHSIFVFLIVIGVQHVWGKVQYWTNKFFYRGRYEHFEALERLREEAQSISDPSSIQTSVPQLINQAMRSSHIYLLLPSHFAGDFRVVACSGSADPDAHHSLSKDSAVIRWLSDHKRLLRWNSEEGSLLLESVNTREKETIDKMAGYINVPLNSGDRLVGLLVVGPKVDHHPYSWEDERLLMSIANQMALTIENIQLYQASLERESQLTALSTLNKTVSSSLDIQSIYNVFAEELKKTMSVDWASISLIEGNELRFFALSTEIDSSWGQPGTAVPLEGTGAEWVARKKKPLIEPDLARERRFWTGDVHLEQGIRSMVYLPLFSKGETFGSFIVGSSKPHAYTESDVMFLEQVSNQLSLAMENARLYSKERSERARLEAMNNQRDDFLGIISHELKTPLTSIKSSSELLSEELSKDKQASRKRLIENIRRSADRLEAMLNHMLDMVQSRSAVLEANLRPTDIIPTVRNALELCAPPIEKKRQLLAIDMGKVLN